MSDAELTFLIGKELATTSAGTWSDSISAIETTKVLADTPVISETLRLSADKYLYTEADPDLLPPQDHEGYVQLNSYYGQDYIVFDDEYSVGSRESTFSTL
jgi:hypothetical protein